MHKYEVITTGNGYWVRATDGTLTQVIGQDGAIIAPISLSLGDDDILTAGTTTATAATKITMEFDKTTTGVGQYICGSISVPQVLNTNPGATVSVDTINIIHSAGAGDCDDLIGRYTKVAVSGDGDSGLTLVGSAPRAYIGTVAGSTTVASQCYGSQPWVSHFGTGAVTAMSALSAKCDVNTGNFTATTVNAGHFHVEGASTVTSSMFDGVMIEIYPDVTCLDAGLRIVADTGAVMASGIDIQGAMTNAILAPNDANVRIGTTRTTAETYIGFEFDETTTGIGITTMGSTSAPMVLNTNPGATVISDTINILHSAGAGDCADLIGRYTKVAISGAGDVDTTIVADAPRAYILAGTASAAYASQPWISHAGTGAITAMSAVSAKCDVNADNFTASTVNAGHFHIEGAATVTGQFDGVMIEVYPDVTCLDSGLAIAVDSGAVVASGIRISGTPKNGIQLQNGTSISGGAGTDDSTIKTEQGATAPAGSIYIGANGTVFVMVSTTWTALTIN